MLFFCYNKINRNYLIFQDIEFKAMQLKLTTLAAAVVKKGVVMEINNKKNNLSRIRVSFIMLLFAICLTVNVLFCSAYNFYELLDKTTVTKTWVNSESIVVNEGSDNTTYVKASFLNKNNSYNETITRNMSPKLMIADIPKGTNLLLFLMIVFLFFFLTLFILLPDGWTLINQKVRLDN